MIIVSATPMAATEKAARANQKCGQDWRSQIQTRIDINPAVRQMLPIAAWQIVTQPIDAPVAPIEGRNTYLWPHFTTRAARPELSGRSAHEGLNSAGEVAVQCVPTTSFGNVGIEETDRGLARRGTA